jgi:UPF0716 protein FxsA
MLIKLFLAFTLIPILELYLLIEVGSYLGALNTIIIVIVTGVVGAYLARLQGFQTMNRIRESFNRGEMPTEGLIDAVLILLAGIVLLTPGFLTDIAGLLILVPQTRSRFKRWIMGKLENWVRNNRVDIHYYR